MEELVDILVATYNTEEEFLRKQIDSILRQTHKNIKIYISDDKSTDPKIEKILREYEKKDERIKIFIQPINIGYNKNFEFLLKKSKAKYIMFSDHDDVWHRNKVEKCLKTIKEKDVDMVYCDCRQIDENGMVLQESYVKYKNVPIVNGKNQIAISRCVGIGCSQMITKEIRTEMFPFKKRVIAHDWLAAFLANQGKGIAYIKEQLFDYRLHNANVFGGRSLNQNISRWKAKYGDEYESYLKYRKDVIKRAYLDGLIMCRQYAKDEDCKKFIADAINYCEMIIKTEKINWHIFTYFKIFAGKNIGKKMIREIILFHFPSIAYLIFLKFKI